MKLIKARRIQRNLPWVINKLKEEDFGDIYLEQPGKCRSWTGNFKDIKDKLFGAIIHGCMCDMRDEKEGALLKKEWCIATSDEKFNENVGRVC
eukprot:9466466-Pyramimonas_sp.AAC.1